MTILEMGISYYLRTIMNEFHWETDLVRFAVEHVFFEGFGFAYAVFGD